MIPSNLRNWPIFHFLEPNFIPRIRMAFAFGDRGDLALIATNDKMVYGIGEYGSSILEPGKIGSTLSSRKIDVLCGKNMKTFACSETTILALTEEGEVYICRRTLRSFLQDFTFHLLPRVSTNFIHVACGKSFFLTLTDSGDVYTWVEVIRDRKLTYKEIRKVSFDNMKIVHITCGVSFCAIVTDNGEVYSWGNNFGGQLGLGDNNRRTEPCRITYLSEVAIEKVVCGYSHVLALSSKGVLYAWGDINFESMFMLGRTGVQNKYVPKKINVPEMGRVFDVAASCYSSISVAMGEANRIFIWGKCRNQYIDIPTLTSLKCVHDAFALYSRDGVMHQPLILNDEEETSVMDSMKDAFDDTTTSDFTIQVHGKPIHVHKVVLKMRCNYFRNMFQEHWKENSQSVVEHEQYSYDVYKSFLKYLYTNEIDLSLENALELLNLADAYCERLLKKRSIQIIINGITVKNVAFVYSICTQNNVKELEDYCLKFATYHMTEVVQTESFAELDESVSKDFVIKAAKA